MSLDNSTAVTDNTMVTNLETTGLGAKTNEIFDKYFLS
jgi:hypothetical protein